MSLRTRSQKRYFFPVAISALAIALSGFWFTYWKPLFNGESFPILLHFHAALWFGWLILFVVQTGLIQTENRRIHQRVGIGGVLYTIVLIVLSLYIALQTIARDIHLITNSTESVPTIIPLTQILMFTVFFALGTIKRHHSDLHRRFLALAALVAATPALARISIGILGVPSVPTHIHRVKSPDSGGSLYGLACNSSYSSCISLGRHCHPLHSSHPGTISHESGMEVFGQEY